MNSNNNNYNSHNHNNNSSNNMVNYCLMPSEIARLVYGYFLETGCENTAQCFLEESPYLKEFAHGIKNGYPFSTMPYNQSLLQMLNFAFRMSCTQNNNNSNIPIKFDDDKLNGNFIYKNNFTTKIEVLGKNSETKTQIHSNNEMCPKHKILQSRNSNQYSPRRKSAMPKRFGTIVNNIHQNESNLFKTNVSVPTLENQLNFSSPTFSSSACESSEIDVQVQPQIIFDELLKYGPLHDKVANTIQKIICDKDNPDSSNIQSSKDQTNSEELNSIVNNNCVENKVGDIEKDLLPAETLVEIIDSLTEEPVFNDFVEMVVEKEIANTPFKLCNTPSSNSSANTSSLNTPNVFLTPNLKNSPKVDNTKPIPVKNLLKDLQTPEKRPSTVVDHKENFNCDIEKNISTSLISKNEVQQIDDCQNQLLSINSSDKIQKQNFIESNTWKNKTNNEQNVLIKPIFQNHNLISKMNTRILKLKDNQKEVQEALNYCPTTDVNDSDNKINKEKLTTTIEEISENDSQSKNIKETLTTDVQPQELNSVELVSVPNWSSNSLSQPIIAIPNNQISWNNGFIYVSYPTQETIYYIDPKVPLVSSTMTKNNDNFVQMPITTVDEQSINQKNGFIPEQRTETTTQIGNNDIVEIIKTNQSSPTSKRIVPSILSKGKQKMTLPNIENKSKSVDPIVIDNNNSNKNSSPTRKETGRKSEILPRTENNKKRKVDYESSFKNKRNSLSSTSDQKIKTLLHSDIDKFLVNIHKDKKDKV